MPLDSTGSNFNAEAAKQITSHSSESGAERKKCAEATKPPPWHYLFVHRAKVEVVCDKVEKEYPVFIHRKITYREERNHVRKDKRATISGLVFVRGDSVGIQRLLNSYFYGMFLSRDCATSQVATIPDGTMQAFIKVMEIAPTRIRFMPHPLGYYSEDNVMVRLTSGPLAGMEGFRIRIARDRCLVTSVGGLTVAIGGIHGDSFENADDYVRQRRLAQSAEREEAAPPFTAIQADVDSCFFLPQNQLDVLAMAASLRSRVVRAGQNVWARHFSEAVEAATAMLSEAGSRYPAITAALRNAQCPDLIEVLRKARDIMETVIGRSDTPADINENVAAALESLPIRHPELWAALERR